MTERPSSWANWREHAAGKEARSAHEFDLYSDSVVHGSARDFGPYRVMNLIAGERRETALARPVITLRVRYAANPNPQLEDAEHGGRHPDEIAALMSLSLGIRLQAGAKTRRFDLSKRDELGDPCAQAEVETPSLLPGAWTPIIAHAKRTTNLRELDVLDGYPTLPPAEATALMRAARLYQEGLWLSERESWLTWLLLVSSVETAANAFKHEGEAAPEELLRELDPKLASVCAKYGDACVREVAKTQVRLLGATKKFLVFLETFLPGPPAVRPDRYRLDWTWAALREPLRLIYGMRSAHLHAGVPFPWQLRGTPEPYDGVPTEQGRDLIEEARRSDDAEMINEKVPMHLHVFEHIVRGALLRWWVSMVPVSPTP